MTIDPLDLDSQNYNLFCDIPGGGTEFKDPSSSKGRKILSKFNGYRSCYYYGCEDAADYDEAKKETKKFGYDDDCRPEEGNCKNACYDIFNRCQGVCFQTDGKGGPADGLHLMAGPGEADAQFDEEPLSSSPSA